MYYSFDQILEFINDAMKKRDRSIHMSINPEIGVAINVYPWPNYADLYRITSAGFNEMIGETEMDYSFDQILEFINDVMKKRDRSIHMSINSEIGVAINVYPWPDYEDLYRMFYEGQITSAEFYEMIGETDD